MKNDISEAVISARKGLVLFDLSDAYSVLEISGDDRESFLHALTSNEITGLPIDRGNRQAILTKKSTILADFHLYKLDDRLLLLFERFQQKSIEEQLDAYHFAEEVVFQPKSSAVFALQGDASGHFLRALVPELQNASPWEQEQIFAGAINGEEVLIISHSLTGDPGFLIITDADAHAALKQTLLAPTENLQVTEYSADILEVLRIEAGQIRFGVDFDEKTLLLELNLGEKIYNLNKGCYPGQEVVARVINKGKIGRKLVGIISDRESVFRSGMDVSVDGKSVGTIKSTTWSPTLKKSIAIANLKRDFTDAGAEFLFEMDGSAVQSTITRLPFYFSPTWKKEVESLYHRGMQHYHDNQFEAAKKLFEKAVRIKNDAADVWEALAMTIEKMGDLDGAISLNRTYAELDPLAVMARSNLSRLYMLKGFKDRAEEEQAKATVISFKLKALENKIDKKAHQQFEKQQHQMQQAELERKLSIFKQVIELDAEDEIANFGAGKLYLDSGKYEQAIRHLQIVIRVNPQYSAAYDVLTKALVKNGNFDDARTVLIQGIAVAEGKGDLMPAKSMKELLSKL